MLTKLNEREAKAFYSIDPVIVEYLERQVKEINDRNSVEPDEVHTRWNQGAVQALRDLLAKPGQARALL